MKTTVRLAAFVVLAYALGIAPIAQTHAIEMELRVITLKHRLADEVVPVVRPLLAPGESVSGMDTRLMIRATPHTFSQIERLLAELDTPRRNLRISLRHTDERDPLQSTQSFSGDTQRSNVRITKTNGDRGTLDTSDKQFDPDQGTQGNSGRHTTTKSDISTQILTVLDGGQAFLHIGETIAEVQPFLALAGRRLGAVAGIQYYDVTTGFEVVPRIVGELIQLRVTPRLAFRSNQGAQTINFQELHTEVMVKPNAWVDLGGVVDTSSDVSRQILSTGHAESRILIRVDPL
jgi:hypothetical protein